MFNQEINKKSIIWFLLISFSLAWTLFLLPLSAGAPGSSGWQKLSIFAWSAAMWAPGLAAIIVTRFVEKKPLSSLNLRRLGPARNYLIAWLVPIALSVATGLLTWLTGAGKLDLEFTAIRKSLEQAQTTQMGPVMVIMIQLAIAFTLGPLFNTLFALGEELGWRGFLLVRLERLGQLRAILLSGIIWGIWHAPAIIQGHNYPGQPVLGVFMMIVFCVLFGTILSWLFFRSRSPWTAALGHGSLNAVAGLPILFMPGVNVILGGSITSLIGWIPMIIFIAWLLWTKRLPVAADLSEVQPSLAA
jgi:membrane protease YdiL (CAAX protease family)